MAWLDTRCGLWRRAAMGLLVLLLVPLCVLCLPTPPADAQKFDFWVLHTGVKEQQDKLPINRETYFLVNDSLRMLCKYAVNSGADYCAERLHTNLTVYPRDQDKALILQNMVIIEKTKCNLTVEFQNVTLAFEGEYRCADLLNPGPFRPRRFYVGEAPVAPRNVNFEADLQSYLFTVTLDPVKTGKQLNDPNTRWVVTFTWKNRTKTRHCSLTSSDVKCMHLTPKGLCRACVFPLNYTGCGEFTMGTIDLSIRFKWSVVNSFGSFTTRSSSRLPKWVKPGPISKLEVRGEVTTSWVLALTAWAPRGVDQAIFYGMDVPMRVDYTVGVLSAREQSLLTAAGARFRAAYDFVRNLHDDQHALNRSLRHANFSGLAESVEWISEAGLSSPLDPMNISTPPLPFPGLHYDLTFTPKAHYWGPSASVNRTQAKTKEAAPLEGPGLDDNFAYCVPTLSSPCTTCVVYIKEIPLTKRGGEITEYILRLRLVGPVSDERSESCENRDGMTLTLEGHNNTFVVPDLAMGGVYEVVVQAVSEAGSANSSVKMLNVTSSPYDFTPREVVVEKSGDQYTLSWGSGDGFEDASLTTYSAFYCYTVPLQLQQPSANTNMQPAQPLNCVTNMVKKTSLGNSSTFDHVQGHRGLTPAFFVSATGPHGHSSGLQRVDCAYHADSHPSAVEIPSIHAQALEGDPGSLKVTFQLPCGGDLDYRYGWPRYYRVALVLNSHGGDCRRQCQEFMRGQVGSGPQSTAGRLTTEVEYVQRRLESDSRYCVGVNVAGRFGSFHPDTWSCVGASTGKPPSDWSTKVLIPVVFGVFALLLVCGLACVFCRRFQKAHGKFTPDMDFTLNHSGKECSEGSEDQSSGGTVNQVFSLHIPEANDAPHPSEHAGADSGSQGKEGSSEQTSIGSSEGTESVEDAPDAAVPGQSLQDAAGDPNGGSFAPPADRYPAGPLLPAAQRVVSGGSVSEGEAESAVEEEEEEEEGSVRKSLREGDDGDDDLQSDGVCESEKAPPKMERIISDEAKTPVRDDALDQPEKFRPRTVSGKGGSTADPDLDPVSVHLKDIFDLADEACPGFSLTLETIDVGDSQPTADMAGPGSQGIAAVTPALPAVPDSGPKMGSVDHPPDPQPPPKSASPCVWGSSPGKVVSEPPASSAQPVAACRGQGEISHLPVEAASIQGPGLSSSDMESVLQSFSNSCADMVELTPLVIADAGDVTDPPFQNLQGQTESTLPGHPPAGSDAERTSPESEGLGQSSSNTSLNMDMIRRAAESCGWKELELMPIDMSESLSGPPAVAADLQHQDSRSDVDSLPCSSKESGFSTDKDLTSSAESGLEQLVPQPDPLPSKRAGRDLLGPHQTQGPRSLGLRRASSDAEESLLGSSDTGSPENGRSLSECPLLSFPYDSCPQVTSRAASSDCSQQLTVRL